jgi:hypothetical protein
MIHVYSSGKRMSSILRVQGRKSEEHPPTLTSFAEGYGGQEATEDRESEERRVRESSEFRGSGFKGSKVQGSRFKGSAFSVEKHQTICC